ncbi:hypothetical protein BKA63DRAFT_130946 [Paraphoma chrysanthemicola]|nr:hypothetical protein BKA63DRAFT_130946 [Paraphoma chrysanthemicola]
MHCVSATLFRIILTFGVLLVGKPTVQSLWMCSTCSHPLGEASVAVGVVSLASVVSVSGLWIAGSGRPWGIQCYIEATLLFIPGHEKAPCPVIPEVRRELALLHLYVCSQIALKLSNIASPLFIFCIAFFQIVMVDPRKTLGQRNVYRIRLDPAGS